MERKNEITLALILLALALVAYVGAWTLEGKATVIMLATFGGIAMTLFGMALPGAAGWRPNHWTQEDIAKAMRETYCQHLSVNMLSDKDGDCYFFCDRCGEQVDGPEVEHGEAISSAQSH